MEWPSLSSLQEYVESLAAGLHHPIEGHQESGGAGSALRSGLFPRAPS